MKCKDGGDLNLQLILHHKTFKNSLIFYEGTVQGLHKQRYEKPHYLFCGVIIYVLATEIFKASVLMRRL